LNNFVLKENKYRTEYFYLQFFLRTWWFYLSFLWKKFVQLILRGMIRGPIYNSSPRIPRNPLIPIMRLDVHNTMIKSRQEFVKSPQLIWVVQWISTVTFNPMVLPTLSLFVNSRTLWSLLTVMMTVTEWDSIYIQFHEVNLQFLLKNAEYWVGPSSLQGTCLKKKILVCFWKFWRFSKFNTILHLEFQEIPSW